MHFYYHLLHCACRHRPLRSNGTTSKTRLKVVRWSSGPPSIVAEKSTSTWKTIAFSRSTGGTVSSRFVKARLFESRTRIRKMTTLNSNWRARVSTHDQNPDAQRDRLIEAGAIRVFTDIVSGLRFDRPALAKLIDHARPGDRLCIIRLDRLGPSLRELLETVDDLKTRGIHLVSLEERLDTSSAAGETRVPRLRLHRALRTPAHLRAYPRWWHRRSQETRANTWPTAAGPGDGFRRSETHQGRIVSRSNRKTARYWQGNSLQDRKGGALKSKPWSFGPLE